MNLDDTNSDYKVVGDNKWRKDDDGIEQFSVLNILCSVDHKKMRKPNNNYSHNNWQVNIKELNINKKYIDTSGN